MEGVAIDLRAGTFTEIINKNTTWVTHTFTAPGPLKGAVSYVEKVHDGVSTITEKYTYDEKSGRLLSKMDDRHLITTYQYDAFGRVIGQQVNLAKDPAVRAELAAREKELLDKLKNEKDPNGRQTILHELVIFYTAKSRDFEKAEKLLPLMTNREAIYNLKLWLAICPNFSVTERNARLEKLAQEFPDKKIYTEAHMIKQETP